MKKQVEYWIDLDVSIEEDKKFLLVKHVQTWLINDKEDQFLIQSIMAFRLLCSIVWKNKFFQSLENKEKFVKSRIMRKMKTAGTCLNQ